MIEPVSRAEPGWRADPEHIAPTVLLIGGFLTSPPIYLPLARRLRARGAAAVLVAPIWTPDWLLVDARGMGAIVTRAGRALLRASEASVASPGSHGAPVLVVGHSAGGVVARLLTSPEPFEGRRLNGSGRIGAIVTLGTPHHVGSDGPIGDRIERVATTFANQVVPGAAFAPRVGYMTVASRAVVGRPYGTPRERAAHAVYGGLLGPDERTAIDGDGVVPVESALLEGATQLVLDDAVHGQLAGRPWYGSRAQLDRWWPVALEVWRSALRARVEGAG